MSLSEYYEHFALKHSKGDEQKKEAPECPSQQELNTTSTSPDSLPVRNEDVLALVAGLLYPSKAEVDDKNPMYRIDVGREWSQVMGSAAVAAVNGSGKRSGTPVAKHDTEASLASIPVDSTNVVRDADLDAGSDHDARSLPSVLKRASALDIERILRQSVEETGAYNEELCLDPLNKVSDREPPPIVLFPDCIHSKTVPSDWETQALVDVWPHEPQHVEYEPKIRQWAKENTAKFHPLYQRATATLRGSFVEHGLRSADDRDIEPKSVPYSNQEAWGRLTEALRKEVRLLDDPPFQPYRMSQKALQCIVALCVGNFRIARVLCGAKSDEEMMKYCSPRHHEFSEQINSERAKALNILHTSLFVNNQLVLQLDQDIARIQQQIEMWTHINPPNVASTASTAISTDRSTAHNLNPVLQQLHEDLKTKQQSRWNLTLRHSYLRIMVRDGINNWLTAAQVTLPPQVTRNEPPPEWGVSAQSEPSRTWFIDRQPDDRYILNYHIEYPEHEGTPELDRCQVYLLYAPVIERVFEKLPVPSIPNLWDQKPPGLPTAPKKRAATGSQNRMQAWESPFPVSNADAANGRSRSLTTTGDVIQEAEQCIRTAQLAITGNFGKQPLSRESLARYKQQKERLQKERSERQANGVAARSQSSSRSAIESIQSEPTSKGEINLHNSDDDTASTRSNTSERVNEFAATHEEMVAVQSLDVPVRQDDESGSDGPTSSSSNASADRSTFTKALSESKSNDAADMAVSINQPHASHEEMDETAAAQSLAVPVRQDDETTSDRPTSSSSNSSADLLVFTETVLESQDNDAVAQPQSPSRSALGTDFVETSEVEGNPHSLDDDATSTPSTTTFIQQLSDLFPSQTDESALERQASLPLNAASGPLAFADALSESQDNDAVSQPQSPSRSALETQFEEASEVEGNPHSLDDGAASSRLDVPERINQPPASYTDTTANPLDPANTSAAPITKEDQYNEGLRLWSVPKIKRSNLRKALQLFKEAATAGHVDAMMHLGECFDQGARMETDADQACYWYKQAALSSDNPEANYKAGYCLAKGRGGKQDLAGAKKAFERAAQNNHPQALFKLGMMYHEGQGVTQDFKTAAEWYKKAAAQNHAIAQFQLGVMYDEGQGVMEDFKTAATWYKKAAAQNHVVAQYNLGSMYLHGDGVTKNHNKAKKWYKKAAKLGYIAAQYTLGELYLSNRNFVQAKVWFQKAANEGHPDAIKQVNGWAHDQDDGDDSSDASSDFGSSSGEPSLFLPGQSGRNPTWLKREKIRRVVRQLNKWHLAELAESAESADPADPAVGPADDSAVLSDGHDSDSSPIQPMHWSGQSGAMCVGGTDALLDDDSESEGEGEEDMWGKHSQPRRVLAHMRRAGPAKPSSPPPTDNDDRNSKGKGQGLTNYRTLYEVLTDIGQAIPAIPPTTTAATQRNGRRVSEDESEAKDRR